MTVLCHMFAICCGHVPLHSPQKQALYIYIHTYIYLDPPNPRKISAFSECEVYRLSLPKTPRYYFGLQFYDFDCMFLGLVKQKLKNVCSASNDQGTNPRNPEKKKSKNTHTHKKKTRKSRNLVVLGSFLLFLGFQNSSRFVYVSVVLRFS